MANHSLPTTASTYGNYTSELDGRLKDAAYLNDPAATTVTNPPTNMKRWNSAQNRWEKYDGTSWVVMAASYAITVAAAEALATPRTASLTGDATGTSAAWTGSGNLSIPLTLATVNSNTGTFGSSAAVPVITVNAKGLITAVSTAALGSMATQSAGSVAITGGSVAGTTITLKQSTTAAPTGEGVIEWDTDDDVVKVGTGTATKTLVNTDNTQTLTNKTMGSGSTWNGNAVPVANGGTGATDAASARTNLGVASMGTQSSSAVSITGGNISGTTLTLKQSTAAAPTAEGAIEWDTDNDLLVLGTSTGTKIMVDTDSPQTLTNKTITGSFVGNASTVTNGVYTTGSYADPSWITSLNYSKLTGTVPTWNQNTTGSSASCTGNSATATYLSATQQTNVITFKQASLAMVASDTTANGGGVFKATGAGDANLAGCTFWNDAYAIKMGVRADGYFGLGGWSRAAWSWYSDPSGNMVAAGNVTAYSDPRLKENFERIADPFAILHRLDGGTFTWKHGYKHIEVKAGKRDYGMLANQVKAVMPEIVSPSIEIEGEVYDTVAYEKLVPVLIEAVKRLDLRVKELEGLL